MKMAYQSFADSAQEQLECPVCSELFKAPNTPKILDCFHECCVVCIKKIIEGGRKVVDCPICRHKTRIPNEGVERMQTNRRIRDLAEKHERHIIERGKFCPQHHGISIDWYCKKCNVSACAACITEKHHGPKHDAVKIDDILKERGDGVNVIIQMILDKIEKCKQSRNQLDNLRCEIEDNVKIQCKHVEDETERAVKKLNEDEIQLKEELEKSEQPRTDLLKDRSGHLTTQIEKSENILDKVTNEAASLEPRELVYKQVQMQLEQTMEALSRLDLNVDSSVVIGMTKYICRNSLEVTGKRGRILKIRKLECEMKAEVMKNRDQSFQGATSVEVSPDGFIIINDTEAGKVYLYSEQQPGSCKYEKRLKFDLSTINTKTKPLGAAVSSGGEILVTRKTHVEVYSQKGKYKRVLNLRTEEGDVVSFAYGVKVMPDGRIVIGDSNSLQLIILSPNETIQNIVRTSIALGRIVIMPNECIAMSNWSESRVCIIDMITGLGVRTIPIPNAIAVCYHEETDSLIIGRNERMKGATPIIGTGVIDQYCATTGKFVKRLAQGLHHPRDLLLNADGLLVVADYKTVKLYKVT